MVNFRSSSEARDFFLDVARGNVPGVSHINKFGRSPDLDQIGSVTAVTIGRSIWDGSVAGAVNWLAPTTARIHQIVSTDADDTAAGAGARTVRIYGLDADYLLQEETITLNGTTDVPTVNTYTMIYRMEVLTAGATDSNEGIITATADTDGTITARISVNFSQTLMVIYQIPADKTGYIVHYDASLHKQGGGTKLVDIFLMSKKFGGPLQIRDSGSVASDGGIHLEHEFKPWEKLEPKETIQVMANPSADAQDISAGFDIVLVDIAGEV